MYKLKSFVTVFVAGTIFLSGCTLKKMVKMAKDQQLTVTPSPVELHGGEVKFDVSVLLPVKMLKKNTLYKVNAFYQYGDQKVDLGTLELKASDFPDNTIQPKMTQTLSFPYSPEQRRGKVMVVGEAAKVTGKSLPTPPMEIADGVITTSELAKDEFTPAYAFHGYNNQEELIPTNVAFYFLKGSAQLRTTEIKGGEGKRMSAFIAEKNVTRVVSIYGHHSPEGSESINTKLSENRAKAVEAFYRQQMKRYDYKDMAKDIKFELKPVSLDWKKFRDAIKATAILSDAEKKQVMDIIDVKGADFIEQEKQLQKLSFYKKMEKEIYPSIRTAKTEILTVKDKKTDAEISAIASQIIKGEQPKDTLNVAELGYAATLTNDLTEREKIYLELTKRAQTWQSHNNLGALYLEQALAAPKADKAALIEKAISQLNLSVKKQEAGENLHNLAVAQTMKGQFDLARENGIKALSAPADAELVKTIKSTLAPQYIRSGDYDQALKMLETSTLSNTSKFNLALVQLLMKDFNAAGKNFDMLTQTDAENAHAFYGAAVTAARTGDESTMAARLKKSIELDSSLRTRAVDDLEFIKYFEKDSYKNAIK
jgi:outer membrane protein OmpA-like peptidoglycan-associated protein